MYIRSNKDSVNFLSIHCTDNDWISWVIRNQLPVESLMEMTVNTKIYRLATDAVQCYTYVGVCTKIKPESLISYAWHHQRDTENLAHY